MDGKGLVQFALMGNGHLEQYAILLVRVSIGLFFAISGANKLFVTVQGSDPPSEQRGCSNLAAMAAYRFREVTQHVTLLPLAGLGDRE